MKKLCELKPDDTLYSTVVYKAQGDKSALKPKSRKIEKIIVYDDMFEIWLNRDTLVTLHAKDIENDSVILETSPNVFEIHSTSLNAITAAINEVA